MDHNGGPNAILAGAPTPPITEEEQFLHLADLSVAEVKIPRGNRYEHFEATAETTLVEDRELRVFMWTHSTYVAE